MKGPFATSEAAYAAATLGEVIMTREAPTWAEREWCVMDEVEALCIFDDPNCEWVAWDLVEPRHAPSARAITQGPGRYAGKILVLFLALFGLASLVIKGAVWVR